MSDIIPAQPEYFVVFFIASVAAGLDGSHIAAMRQPVVAWRIINDEGEEEAHPVCIDRVPDEYALQVPDGRLFHYSGAVYESVADYRKAYVRDTAQRVSA